MSELDLQASFLEAVPYAFPDARAFRRQIVNGKMERGYHVRAGVKGQADVYVYIRGGRVVEVELKHRNLSRSKSTRAAQRAWRKYCEDFQIPYLVLRSIANEAPADTVNRWVRELGAAIRG